MSRLKDLKRLELLFSLVFMAVAAPLQAGVTFYHPDQTGSPVMATDSVGTVVWTARYSAFGRRFVGEQSDSRSFTGHEEDPETNLIYMQARFYDPRLGRFLSMDPAPQQFNDPSTFNRYAYANNNPYVFIDPDGRDSYLVSRPVDGIAGRWFNKRHNFIVTHADYPGDRTATVWSFGRNSFGHTGRVDDTTLGWSSSTHGTDNDFWRSLEGNPAKTEVHTTRLTADDDSVASQARRLIEDTNYMVVPVGTATNSNSAASAVANGVEGEAVPIPDGDNGGNSPGYDHAEEIRFVQPWPFQ